MGCSKAYHVDEWSGDDLVLEWNVATSWTPFSLVGTNPDAQSLINKGLITREMRGTQHIIRLTIGFRARIGTQYSCWDCLDADAQNLCNSIVFKEGRPL